jgi:hypothetical protein
MKAAPFLTRRRSRRCLPHWAATLTLWLAVLPTFATAAITYVGRTSTGSAAQTSTMTLTGPAGLATGDLMIATVAQAGSASWTAPGGWTTLLTSNGTRAPRLVVWYRIATGADSSSTPYTFTSSGSQDRTGGILAFRGVDGSAPIATSAIQANASSNSAIAPAITPGIANSMLVAIWGVGNSMAVTIPGSMTGSISTTGLDNANLLAAYQLLTASGNTGTRTATMQDAVTSNGLLIALTPSPAVSTIDHYELSLPSTSLACLTSTVKVTACSNTSSPCTSAATTQSGKTATLSTAGATLAATTVTFNASGVASTTLSYPAANNGATVSVTLSGEQTAAASSRQCCPNGSSCSVANSCSSTFSTSGFIVSASAGGTTATLPTQTAGTTSGTYYLRAVKTSTTSLSCEAALSGSTTVNWAYQCNNPTTCSSGNRMMLTGNSATTIAANPNSGVSTYLPVSMTFDANGNAPFTFNYADVGQVTLAASKSAGGMLLSALTGTSNAFVVKPGGFAVSNIQQTAAPQLVNPSAASAAGSRFVKAGQSFTATVTAQTSGGATTPNYGRETSPEGVLLTHTLVLPSGGATGTLSNGSIAGASFGSGVATPTKLAWNEVGIITLTPSVADADYLGVGDVTGTTSGNIGRFVPAQFALSSGMVTNRAGQGCAPASAFSYLGESFKLGFTLTAQNGAGATTANYSGNFAKLDLTAVAGWNLRGIDTSTVFSAGNGRLAPASAAGTWSNGVAAATSIIAASVRAAAPEAPFTIQLGIAPVDSDGVAMQAFDLVTTLLAPADRAQVSSVVARSGRLRLSNAFGSEKSSLQMTVQAQYWGGNAWVPNNADSCTTLPVTAIVRSGYLDNKGASSSTWSTSASAVVVSGGSGTLTLSAPSPTSTGSVDIALNLGATSTDQSCLATHPASTGAALPWLRSLQGSCAASFDRDPAARATFGVYSPETRKTVHVREIF